MASVLETFYIFFKTDGKEAAKDQKELKKSTEETTFSFAKLGKGLLELGAAYLTTSELVRASKDSFDYASQLGQASEMLNVNASDLDIWGRAVQRAGGTTGEFVSSLESIASKLHITNASALKELPKLADILHQKLLQGGPEAGKQFAESIGLSPHLILLLQRGKGALNDVLEVERKLGVVTKADTDATKNFHQVWSDFGNAISIAFTKSNTQLLPTLGAIFSAITKTIMYAETHPHLIPDSWYNAGVFKSIRGALHQTDSAIIQFVENQSSYAEKFIKSWREALPLILRIFNAIADRIKAIFSGIQEHLSIKGIKDEYQAISNSIFGKNNKKLNQDIALAKNQIHIASTNPLTSQPNNNNIFTHKENNKKTIINLGPIEVNTQATSGHDVSSALSRSLIDQLRQATGTHDDGVLG